MTTPDPDPVIEAMANAAELVPSPAEVDIRALYLAEARAAFAALPSAYRHGPELLAGLHDAKLALESPHCPPTFDAIETALKQIDAALAKVEGNK